MSIKARLTLAIAVLLAVATAVVGVLAVTGARDSMIDQVDERLRAGAAQPPGPGAVRPPGGGLPPGAGVPPEGGGPPAGNDLADEAGEPPYRPTAVLFYSPDGRLVSAVPAGEPSDPEPLPDVPRPGTEAFGRLLDGIETLPARDGSLDYRATATRAPGGGLRVLATSLADTDAAVSHLIMIVIVTGVLVLLIGAGASWLVIRRGLRPVDTMIDTASAIAAGDLSRRVRPEESRTELGRLATALDDMLTQLEAAFAEREASEHRLKRFVADAAHELRTPVTAIRGYAELYRRGGLEGDKLDRAMTRVESESVRMGSLVDDLLLLARLDQQQPLVREPADLAALARDGVADAEAVDPRRPITVHAADPVMVEGDERRLRQVIANLLSNARVHTPPGTPVEVRVSPDGDRARLAVSDQGPGIAPADQARLFERFYRADPSRSRETGGSGLGLAIVSAVVEAHGGSVAVESAPGAGATFTVELPRVPEGRADQGGAPAGG